MRTCFGTEEGEEYRAVRELLVRRCRTWAEEQGVSLVPDVIDAALQYRHECHDGRLGFWRPAEVRGFLIEWVPERVAAEPDDLACVPEALRTFLRYLDAVGLRDPRAGDLAEAERAIDRAVPAFSEAVRDQERYSVTKYWKLTAARHGIALVDRLGLERLKSGVAAGRIPHDRDLLIRLAERAPAPLRRAVAPPPRALPGPDELREAAERSAVVRRMTALASWAGQEGRPLTSRGQIPPVEARALVRLLENGNGSGDAGDLPLLVAWARKARIVRVHGGRLSAVAKAAPVLADPLALWRRAFTAFTALGEEFCGAGSVLRGDFADAVPEMLAALYGLPGPVPGHRLQDKVWLYCTAPYDLAEVEDDQRVMWRAALDRDLALTLRALNDLGVLELQGPLLPEQGRGRRGGTRDVAHTPSVSLTALGSAEVRERLLAQGRECGRVGELVAADPAGMLGVVAERYPADAARAEIRGWLAAHGDDVSALLEAVRACPFRERALLLLDTLVDALADGPSLLLSLRDDPWLGPSALTSLVRRGLLDPRGLAPEEHLLTLIDGFLRLLEVAGADAVRETLRRDFPPHELALLAVDVLDAGHPDEAGLADLCALVLAPLTDRRPRRDAPADPMPEPMPDPRGAP
ncbi:hypothetical protein [Actinocorallia sp. A-T 12471]|uniref:hypothetical protein n=1 Tax=Actinocorallia sp. A-T 12471 TaxID=3089813 RepID=UPI0029CC25C9|nr:hypothetical protein [Actinocorallia sp. A-T 12471]MDX6738720.1 hypothetical protein [Actinocorallia sp. A-T 12471]